MKHCIPCNRDLPLSEFWKNKATKDGYQAWCKSCWKKITDKRRNGPKRKIELRQRQNRHLVRTFGITIEDYENILKNQGGVCAICKKEPYTKRKLVVDHCHSKGNIRGLLCENCNRALGMLRDSTEYLKNAIVYLS